MSTSQAKRPQQETVALPLCLWSYLLAFLPSLILFQPHLPPGCPSNNVNILFLPQGLWSWPSVSLELRSPRELPGSITRVLQSLLKCLLNREVFLDHLLTLYFPTLLHLSSQHSSPQTRSTCLFNRLVSVSHLRDELREGCRISLWSLPEMEWAPREWLRRGRAPPLGGHCSTQTLGSSGPCRPCSVNLFSHHLNVDLEFLHFRRTLQRLKLKSIGLLSPKMP